MNMINIFSAPKDAFKDMLTVGGQEFYHNGKKRFGIITNPEIKEFNDKYVSTDCKLVRGDYIHYDSTYWMVWNQVNVARAEAFKGIMRQAEHTVTFNLYYAGVMSEYLLKCPAIISRTSDYTLRADENMSLIDSEIHVFVQDTVSTRKINDLVGKRDGQIVVGQRNYDIQGVSYEKQGYLDITCKMGLKNATTDYENGIYWNTDGKQGGWQDNYNLAFYEREGEQTVLPSIPMNYQTSVVLTLSSDAQTASVTARWTQEANKATYANFTGYKVRLLKNGSEIAMNVMSADTLTHSFNGLQAGEYVVELYAVFGGENVTLPITQTVGVVSESAPTLTPNGVITSVSMTSYDDSNSYGTLVWETDKNANKFNGFTLTGYRVEVWSSMAFTDDVMRDYWTTSTENQEIRTGWTGENGWYVLVYSMYNHGVEISKPQRFEGDYLTSLPNEAYGLPW